ncbi:TMEM175 family protein [Streptococcus halotolerans]|uniref:TMEM175 family protein n=1 Tax=Streptococcus halotolerans TaxID=1814128 RepID=UPI0007870497|nr:TMEM175 family protein [Streptococcus halotolerans]
MSKERCSAFFDAVLAIIMTILILELEVPQTLNVQGLWKITPSIFSYVLSFFWLGTMWVGIHNIWHKATKISSLTVWTQLLLLFFVSFFPYTTKIVAAHFQNSFTQVMYGMITILVSVCVTWSNYTLVQADRNNKILMTEVKSSVLMLCVDLAVKFIGLLLAVTVYPPAMMYSILIAGFLIILPHRVVNDLARNN